MAQPQEQAAAGAQRDPREESASSIAPRAAPASAEAGRESWRFHAGEVATESTWSVFVGDLAHDVDDGVLQATFHSQFESTSGAQASGGEAFAYLRQRHGSRTGGGLG